MFLKRYRYQQNRPSEAPQINTLNCTLSPNQQQQYSYLNQSTVRNSTQQNSNLSASNKLNPQLRSGRELQIPIKPSNRLKNTASTASLIIKNKDQKFERMVSQNKFMSRNESASNIIERNSTQIKSTSKTQQVSKIMNTTVKLESGKIQDYVMSSKRYQTPRINQQQQQIQKDKNSSKISQSLRCGKKSQVNIKPLDLIIEEENNLNQPSINKPRQSINQSSSKYEREKSLKSYKGGIGNLTINFSTSKIQLFDQNALDNDHQDFNTQQKQKYNSLLTAHIPSTQRNQDFLYRGRSLGNTYDSFKISSNFKTQTQGLGDRLSQTLNSQDRPSATRGGIGKLTNIKPHSFSPISINVRNLSASRQRGTSVVSLTDSVKNTNSQLKNTKKSLNDFIRKYKVLDLELEKLTLTRSEQLQSFNQVRLKLSDLSEYLTTDYNFLKNLQGIRQLESDQIQGLDLFLQEVQKTSRDRQQRIIPIQVLVNPHQYVPKIIEALKIKVVKREENQGQIDVNEFKSLNIFQLLEHWTQTKLEYNNLKKQLLVTKNNLIDHRQLRDLTLKDMLDNDKQVKQLSRQKSVQIKRLKLSIDNQSQGISYQSQGQQNLYEETKEQRSQNENFNKSKVLSQSGFNHLQNPTILMRTTDSKNQLGQVASVNQTPNKVDFSKIILNNQDNSNSRILANPNFSNDSSHLQFQHDQSKSINTKLLKDSPSMNQLNEIDQTPRNNTSDKQKSLQSHNLASRSMYLQHRQSTNIDKDNQIKLLKTTSKGKFQESIEQSSSFLNSKQQEQSLGIAMSGVKMEKGLNSNSSKFLSPMQMLMTGDQDSQNSGHLFLQAPDQNALHYSSSRNLGNQMQFQTQGQIHSDNLLKIFSITKSHLNSQANQYNSITPDYLSYTDAQKPVPRSNDYGDEINEDEIDDYLIKDSKLEIELLSQGEQIKLQNLAHNQNHSSRNLNSIHNNLSPSKTQIQNVSQSKFQTNNEDYFPQETQIQHQFPQSKQENGFSMLYQNAKNRQSTQNLIFRTQQPQSKSRKNLLIQLHPETPLLSINDVKPENPHFVNTNFNESQPLAISHQQSVDDEELQEEAPSERSDSDMLNQSQILNTTYTSVCFGRKQIPSFCCYKNSQAETQISQVNEYNEQNYSQLQENSKKDQDRGQQQQNMKQQRRKMIQPIQRKNMKQSQNNSGIMN